MTRIKYLLFNLTNFCVIVIFLTKLLVSVVSIALMFLTNSSYTVFSTTLFFTTSRSLLKSVGVVSILSISDLSISGFKLAISISINQYLLLL